MTAELIKDANNFSYDPDMKYVGSIQGAKGMKGEMKVSLTTAHPSHLVSLESIYLKIDDSESILYTIDKAEWNGSKFTLKLHGVDDRNTAEALRDAKIMIPEEAAYKVGEDEYFIEDLIGMNVVDKSGTNLGRITEVLNYPAHDVYVVSKGDNEILIPAVHEYVQEVNMNTGTVMITTIEDFNN
ncbi:MAG: 16S rRNA processing protein RimM [Candidatus Marinimicrobia bacterium]|nr:16S rRNA processing protein RimM [Candidatus Neomarinimicrobiota bacterium]